jgi:hypothetical protein
MPVAVAQPKPHSHLIEIAQWHSLYWAIFFNLSLFYKEHRMSRILFQITQKKTQVKQQVIIATTADKLKLPEYSVDKTAKKPAENPDTAPKNKP